MIRTLRAALIGAGVVAGTLVVLAIALPGRSDPGPAPTATPVQSGPASVAPGPSSTPAFDTGTLTGPDYDVELTRGPTRWKSQSKLWFNDGTWWAIMLASDDKEFRVFGFDPSSQAWVDTGTPVDTRHNVRMDVLWDGSSLVVLSAGGNPDAASDDARIFRFSYDAETGRYILDADFPVSVTEGGVGPITIARDSTGVLWVTYVTGGEVMMTSTSGDDHLWNAPSRLPADHTTVAADEAAVISFGGDSIGIMWSNQSAAAMYFAVHADGDQRDEWSPTEVAIEERAVADNHVSLRSLMTPDGPIVVAATKTSKDQAKGEGPNSPQILVLLRHPDGTWARSMVGRVTDHHTRPVLAIEADARRIHVFATSPFDGGEIFHKVADLDDLVFEPGAGETFLSTAPRTLISNVTVTKQNVTAETGMMVMASDDQAGHYVSRAVSLGGAAFPTPRLPISTSGASVLMHDTFDPWTAGNPFAHGWVTTAGTAIIERLGEGSIIRLLGGPDGARLCKPFAGDATTAIRATARIEVDTFGTARSSVIKLRAGGSEVMVIRVRSSGALDYTVGAGRLDGPLPIPIGTALLATVTAVPATATYSATLVAEETGQTLLEVTDQALRGYADPIDEVCFEASPNSVPGGLLVDDIEVTRLE